MAGQHTMPRLLIYDRLDAFKCELDPNQVISLVSTEQVNGEHSLEIETTQQLARSDRIVIQDAMSIWHEYVVLGDEGTHNTGGAVVHAYYCIWSLQYDLMGTYIDTQVGIVPGHASVPSAARLGMAAALSGTSRWAIGTIGVTSQASASFYRRSGWDGLKTVLENWGGELQANVTVGKSGVTTRTVDLLAHVGSNTAIRRFDYAADIAGIKRTLAEAPMYCRIVPLTKSEQTENGGYTRRKTIADVNEGVIWLQDDAMVDYVKVPNGSGGWEYPTLIVPNDTYEEPSELLPWALEYITDYTQPEATYEADVVQFAQAGMNVHGVALGDAVTIVDKTFDGDGLRLSARVIKQVVNLLDPSDIKITLGTAKTTLGGQIASLANQVSAISSQVTEAGSYQESSAYFSNLLAQINAQVNAVGGYTYITEGYGLRTYDVPVADPTTGLEANSVVEVKGGTIRIANSKTSQGDWDWKTVFTSGHIVGELVTAAQITTGYIGSAGGTYIDLDENIVNLGETDKAHMVLDDSSLKLYDGNGNVYLYAYDLTADGYLVGDYFVYDGTTYTFPSDHTILDTQVGGYNYPRGLAHYYYINSSGSKVSFSRYWTGFTHTDNTFTVDPSTFLIEYLGYPVTTTGVTFYYQTSDTVAQAFTFGNRSGTALSDTGGLSFAVGEANKAKGNVSSTFGRGLVASSELQHVIGKYNKEDTSDAYAFIVGNGTGTSSSLRSNALTLTWEGLLTAAGGVKADSLTVTNPVTIANGGTGQNGVTTITASSTLLTVSTNMTISSVTYKQWGKLAQIYISWRYSGTMTPDSLGWWSPSGSQLNICTLNTGYRPSVNVYAMGSERASNYILNTSGLIGLRNFYMGANTSSTSHTGNVTFTYILA